MRNCDRTSHTLKSTARTHIATYNQSGFAPAHHNLRPHIATRNLRSQIASHALMNIYKQRCIQWMLLQEILYNIVFIRTKLSSFLKFREIDDPRQFLWKVSVKSFFSCILKNVLWNRMMLHFSLAIVNAVQNGAKTFLKIISYLLIHMTFHEILKLKNIAELQLLLIWDSSTFYLIKPELDIGLFVDFCVFTSFCMMCS